MPYPYVPQPTTKKYNVPKTLAADFDEFLENDIPGHNADYEVLTSWYDRNKEDYVPNYIRGELYPDSTKSRYQNTDNNMNFRASRSSGIKKGDMMIAPSGYIYLFDWEVELQSNNAPTRALRCNMTLEVKRYRQETTDERGYLIEEEGWDTVVRPIPANAYRYDGRPEYSVISGQPGLTPNALTLMSVQYNEDTANLKENDEFVWADDTYVIVDLNYVGVNLSRESGVIVVQAKKKAGGIL